MNSTGGCGSLGIMDQAQSYCNHLVVAQGYGFYLLRKQNHLPPWRCYSNAFLRKLQGLELERYRVVIPTTILSNLSFWQMQKLDGFWRVTMDYCKHNQLANPITAATWMWYLNFSKSV